MTILCQSKISQENLKVVIFNCCIKVAVRIQSALYPKLLVALARVA